MESYISAAQWISQECSLDRTAMIIQKLAGLFRIFSLSAAAVSSASLSTLLFQIIFFFFSPLLHIIVHKPQPKSNQIKGKTHLPLLFVLLGFCIGLATSTKGITFSLGIY